MNERCATLSLLLLLLAPLASGQDVQEEHPKVRAPLPTAEEIAKLPADGGPEFNTRYSNGDLVTFTMIVFEGEKIGGEERPDGDETLEIRYFARSEIATLDTQPWVPAVLDDVFTQRERTHFAPPTWHPSQS